jgi:hypothetical protein
MQCDVPNTCMLLAKVGDNRSAVIHPLGHYNHLQGQGGGWTMVFLLSDEVITSTAALTSCAGLKDVPGKQPR